MSRIDVQTLVLAFEKRIDALEKNPPDKIPTHVVINLLEKSIDEIIKEHFLVLAKKEVKKRVKEDLKNIYQEYISKMLNNILNDDLFRIGLEKSIKQKILEGIKHE